MSKSPIAPLDAYATAKPDEPTFTLQGGDPLAAPLVRLWAHAARIQAGRIKGDADAIYELFSAAIAATPTVERLVSDLLLRAREAEDVSWNMDSYLKGQLGASEEAETSGEKLAVPAVPERLDLHDLRVFAAGRLSNMFSELNEIMARLDATPWVEDPQGYIAAKQLRVIFKSLREVYNIVEPRRDHKLSNALSNA